MHIYFLVIIFFENVNQIFASRQNQSLHLAEMLKVYCFLILLIGVLTANDDCFTEVNGQVKFTGKCTDAKTQLAFTGESLSMKFKLSNSYEITSPTWFVINFGDCLFNSWFYDDEGKAYLRFYSKDSNNIKFFFPIRFEISSNGFNMDGYHHYCTPTFETDGELRIVDFNVGLRSIVNSFTIEFGYDVNIYTKPTPIPPKRAYITIGVVLGVLALFIVIAISVIGILYYVRQKKSKANIQGPSQVAVKIEPPSPKKKSSQKSKKSRKEVTNSEASFPSN